MPFRVRGILWGLVVILHTAPAAAERLQVATKSIPPFVFVDSEANVQGYSIDLWEKIAEDLDLEYEWLIFDSVSEMLDSVKSGEADVAIAAISITAEREVVIDFSHRYYETGLQILVLNRSTHPLVTFLGYLFSWQSLQPIAIVLGLAILTAHLLWFFERRINPDMFPQAYWPGIWEALWWSLVTVTTVGYGDKSPTGPIGRAITIIWMFGGIFLLAYFSSSITANHLQDEITQFHELIGKRVGVIQDTTAAEFLRRQPVRAIEFTSLEPAYQAVADGVVQAFIHDAPTLKYHAAQDLNFRVVGSTMQPQVYGLALPQDSAYLEPINRTLLTLGEAAFLEDLERKWFPNTEF